jgi:tetratricopeptide (TPR) repeat protein
MGSPRLATANEPQGHVPPRVDPRKIACFSRSGFGYAPCWVPGVKLRRLIVLLALLLAPPPLFAQSPEDRAEARRYFDAGNEAYQAGQYAVAARAFEEAYRLAPLSEITFSTAQAYRLAYYQEPQRDRELLRRALALYQRYLEEAPQGKRRSHATMHIEAIERLLGPETPSENDAEASEEPRPKEPKPPATELLVTSRAPGARGRIGSSELFDLPFSLAVSPGKHRVTVQAPGHEPTSVEWLAIENRLVVAQVQLEPKPAKLRVLAPEGAQIAVNTRSVGIAPLAAPLEVPPGESVVRVSLRGRLPLTRQERIERGQIVTVDARDLDVTDQRVAAHWTLAGAGLLALAGTTTAVLAVAAQNRVQAYDESRTREPKTPGELADRNSDFEARDNLRTASIVLFGSALVVGATGALLWWVDTPGSETRASGVRPLVGREMVGLGWSGTH